MLGTFLTPHPSRIGRTLAKPTITLAKFLESPDIKGDTSTISQILKRPLSDDDILSEDMVRHSFLDSIFTLMEI